MDYVTIKRKTHGKGLAGIIDRVSAAVQTGVSGAADGTRAIAVQLARGRVKGCIHAEIIDAGTGDVLKARVFNDTSAVPWSSYLEFGTGLYVDDEGVSDAIRLKRATKIPWYIHTSMVPASFAKYGYPLVVGRDGEMFWEVVGMHPHPYMHPAAVQSQDSSLRTVAGAIREMIRSVVG